MNALVPVRELQKANETFGNLDGLEFKFIGAMDRTNLSGTDLGGVGGEIVKFCQKTGFHISDWQIEERFDFMEGGGTFSRSTNHGSGKIEISFGQPRLYVFKVLRDGEPVGLVFLNSGS